MRKFTLEKRRRPSFLPSLVKIKMHGIRRSSKPAIFVAAYSVAVRTDPASKTTNTSSTRAALLLASSADTQFSIAHAEIDVGRMLQSYREQTWTIYPLKA